MALEKCASKYYYSYSSDPANASKRSWIQSVLNFESRLLSSTLTFESDCCQILPKIKPLALRAGHDSGDPVLNICSENLTVRKNPNQILHKFMLLVSSLLKATVRVPRMQCMYTLVLRPYLGRAVVPEVHRNQKVVQVRVPIIVENT